jgi:hypothetical protein
VNYVKLLCSNSVSCVRCSLPDNIVKAKWIKLFCYYFCVCQKNQTSTKMSSITISRRDPTSERHGSSSNRHTSNSERHASNSERHASNSERHASISHRHTSIASTSEHSSDFVTSSIGTDGMERRRRRGNKEQDRPTDRLSRYTPFLYNSAVPKL